MAHDSYCIPLLIQSNVICRTFAGTSTGELKLVGNYSMQSEKYSIAARDILTLKYGYRLGDEFKQAGYWVSIVPNKPQANVYTLCQKLVPGQFGTTYLCTEIETNAILCLQIHLQGGVDHDHQLPEGAQSAPDKSVQQVKTKT